MGRLQVRLRRLACSPSETGLRLRGAMAVLALLVAGSAPLNGCSGGSRADSAVPSGTTPPAQMTPTPSPAPPTQPA